MSAEARWWFQIFLIFTTVWGRFPILIILTNIFQLGRFNHQPAEAMWNFTGVGRSVPPNWNPNLLAAVFSSWIQLLKAGIVGVSKNRGTPKSMVYSIEMDDLEVYTPIFGNTHMSCSNHGSGKWRDKPLIFRKWHPFSTSMIRVCYDCPFLEGSNHVPKTGLKSVVFSTCFCDVQGWHIANPIDSGRKSTSTSPEVSERFGSVAYNPNFPYLAGYKLLILTIDPNFQLDILVIRQTPGFQCQTQQLPSKGSKEKEEPQQQPQYGNPNSWQVWHDITQWNWEGTPGRYPLKWVPKNPLKWCQNEDKWGLILQNRG